MHKNFLKNREAPHLIVGKMAHTSRVRKFPDKWKAPHLVVGEMVRTLRARKFPKQTVYCLCSRARKFCHVDTEMEREKRLGRRNRRDRLRRTQETDEQRQARFTQHN